MSVNYITQKKRSDCRNNLCIEQEFLETLIKRQIETIQLTTGSKQFCKQGLSELLRQYFNRIFKNLSQCYLIRKLFKKLKSGFKCFQSYVASFFNFLIFISSAYSLFMDYREKTEKEFSYYFFRPGLRTFTSFF